MDEWHADLPQGLAEELRRRHAEPQRAYHDWTHVAALLAWHAERAGHLHDLLAVRLAILFHDAVYDPRAKDNEEQSALLLEQVMAGHCDPASLARAARMIRATAGHQLPEDLDPADQADAAEFLDMDLAILGAAAVHFDRYEAQVRAEYAHVPDHLFAAGRAAILESFLARPVLYFSAWGREKFEAAARANLARSIARLRGG